ncbi:SRPBCC family protein [Alkanindiges sp. WGS2144]|uniref:SRPBCC family protein n=1 Tax=Alkanindiges sp. WGS2144 TaxID=3366808 RepID=UPI003753B5E0
MSKAQKVHIIQDFDFPVAQLFQTLSEHENLRQIFAPVAIKRVQNGQDSRNGVGSARKMSLPLVPSFVETTLVYRENELIEYAITKGITPIKDHYGIMKFINLGERSRLDYTIEFKGRLPFIGTVVKLGLENGIKRGLKKLKP